MEAFEFRATAKDGIIKIPEKYRKKLTHNIKVIVLTEDSIKEVNDDSFPFFGISTNGYKFDREEANER